MKWNVPLSSRTVLLSILIALYFILNVSIFLAVQRVDPNRIFAADSQSYQGAALTLLNDHRFSLSPGDINTPQTFRTPGYPLFILFIYAIFGIYPTLVIIAQILIGTLILWLTYLLAAKLWNRAAGVIALLFVLSDIELIFLAQQLLTEIVFSFTLLCALAAGLLLIARPQPSWKLALLLGGMLALGTLIRPINYYLIFGVVLFLALLGWKRKWGWKSSLGTLLFAILPSLILVGGWQLRNYITTGDPEYSQAQGITLFAYYAADIEALHDHTSLETARQVLQSSLPNMERMTPTEVEQIYRRAGLAVILRYPWLLPVSTLRGLARLMLIPGENSFSNYLGVPTSEKGGPVGDLGRLSPGEYVSKWFYAYRSQFVISWIASAHLLLLYLGSASGMIEVFRRKKNLASHLFLLLILGYFLLTSAGPEANARFRAPLIPILAIFAGEGLYLVIKNLPGSLSRENKASNSWV